MSFARHLLVDGPNILHAWPEFRRRVQRERDAARSQLVQRLTAVHDVEEIRVTVVFDGRGTALAIERPSAQPTLSVVHTPAALTADTVIEQLVANSSDAAACLVASDDLAERETVQAMGATVLRAADLAAWLERVEARQRDALVSLRSSNTREWRQA